MNKKEETLINFLDFEDLKIIQHPDFFSFSLDTVLLGTFITINRTVKKILDLGTGNGAIPLIISKRSKAHITGVELQEVSADLAKRNVVLNKLEDRIDIIHDNMLNISRYFQPQYFDAVVSNPPFFKLDGNENQLNNLDQLTIARHEVTINLEEIIRIASINLRNRGYFALVHRADRLADILNLMDKYKIGVKRIQFVHSKLDKESKIILVEGIRGSDSSLKILPPLISHEENGEYTKVIRNIFKGEYRY